MAMWRKIWREGFAPLFSPTALFALRRGLLGDDPRLWQGVTTMPPPLQCLRSAPVEAACAVGYCGWQGDGLETVGEVESFFARTCHAVDQRLANLGEPMACRWFLNWFDETPRDVVRQELLAEVERSLAGQGGSSAA